MINVEKLIKHIKFIKIYKKNFAGIFIANLEVDSKEFHNIQNKSFFKTTFGGFFGPKMKRFQVPKTAHVSGSCDPSDSHMILTWTEEKSNQSLENSVIFHFSKDSKYFHISDININVYVDKRGIFFSIIFQTFFISRL